MFTPATAASCFVCSAKRESEPIYRSPTTVNGKTAPVPPSNCGGELGRVVRRTRRTVMPSCAATLIHFSCRQDGPERQLAVGRFSTGHDRRESQANRNACIS